MYPGLSHDEIIEECLKELKHHFEVGPEVALISAEKGVQCVPFDEWKQVQMYCFWFFPRFRMVYLGAGACAVDHIALRGRRKHTDNHIWAFPAHFATLCSVLPSGHPSFYKCSILFLTQKPSFR